jgi:micrococcal nuclease
MGALRLAIILIAIFHGACRADSAMVVADVIRVIDGDTIEAFSEGRKKIVRFIGVNAPETLDRVRGVELYGPEASEFTRATLLGRRVWLEFDAGRLDRFGRTMAYVWLDIPSAAMDDEIREKMFNARLLLEGLAHVAIYLPNVRYIGFFKKYQEEAKKANIGLWYRE